MNRAAVGLPSTHEHKPFINILYITHKYFLCIFSDLTLDDVLLRVEGHDGEGVVVEAGEAVDEVGAGERVDVCHGEVEGGGAVDRPGAVVTHDLVVSCSPR